MWLSGRESAQLQYLGIKSFFEVFFFPSGGLRSFCRTHYTNSREIGDAFNEQCVSGVAFTNVCLWDCVYSIKREKKSIL